MSSFTDYENGNDFDEDDASSPKSATMRKPLPIPNVVGQAWIQVIAGDRWKTLWTGIDAPNPIAAAVKRLEKLGHGNLWYRDCVGYRKPLF